MTIAVHQSAVRSSLFADYVLVSTVPPVVGGSDSALELALLRREMVPILQKGTVLEIRADGAASINMESAEFSMQMHDIGHVRIAFSTALDLFNAIATHLIHEDVASPEELKERLQSAMERGK